MTPTDLWAARRERARRWIHGGTHDLRGYPALDADDETKETLAAAPVEKVEKKSKPHADKD
ncbi:MAG TPA: hypothetical protein VFU22_11690 [Roseiflexaceae bacterium]|nr:hypothetical protein [Roseiflexaceae bacterium]